MSEKHCPQCDAVKKKKPVFTVTIDKILAEAIIDMENVGFSEGLGPETEEGHKSWDKFVKTLVEKFNLQNSLYNKRILN